MVESFEKEETPPIKCWGCKRENMYRDCLHKGEIIMTIQNIQEENIVEDVGVDDKNRNEDFARKVLLKPIVIS
jgi:hypothetical protein